MSYEYEYWTGSEKEFKAKLKNLTPHTTLITFTSNIGGMGEKIINAVFKKMIIVK